MIDNAFVVSIRKITPGSLLENGHILRLGNAVFSLHLSTLFDTLLNLYRVCDDRINCDVDLYSRRRPHFGLLSLRSIFVAKWFGSVQPGGMPYISINHSLRLCRNHFFSLSLLSSS